MFHTPAHKQPASLVASRALVAELVDHTAPQPTFDVVVKRGNDLIFPRGNENGDFSEPLWLASVDGGPQFHGRTPDEAAARCRVETLRRVLTVRVYYTASPHADSPLAPHPEVQEFTDPAEAQRWATAQMKWEATVGVVCDQLGFRVEGDFVGVSINKELFAQVPQLKSHH